MTRPNRARGRWAGAGLSFCAMVGLATIAGLDARAEDAGSPPASPADATVAAEVLILHATNESTGIDPKIGKMPALAAPPFSSYRSYKLLDRTGVTLAQSKPAVTKLPTGRELLITLKGVVPATRESPKKYVVTASIQQPDGKTFLPLLAVTAAADEPFFVVGQSYNGGVLVLGIRLTP